MEILVASIQSNDHEVILNRGSSDGIRMGQRFLIYRIGEEIMDPSSGESLGRLELVAGTGTVIHVQERMCTVRSDMAGKPTKKITSASSTLMRFAGERIIEELIPAGPLRFDDPRVGDYAKPI